MRFLGNGNLMGWKLIHDGGDARKIQLQLIVKSWEMSKNGANECPSKELLDVNVRLTNPTMTTWMFPKMVVPPKSSILIGISITNHPFWGNPIFGNTPHASFVLTLVCRSKKYPNLQTKVCLGHSFVANWSTIFRGGQPFFVLRVLVELQQSNCLWQVVVKWAT